MSTDPAATLASDGESPEPPDLIESAVATLEPAETTRAVVRARAVEASERVASVDVIRGVALLGILAMNIVHFAWGDTVYGIPIVALGADDTDTALWAFNHVVFDTKMMTLFSMLFGAGLVLMSKRAEERGAKIRGVYYRRVFWLLVIGLIHAIFIWSGDILVLYALCGFVLYPFRNLKPKTLVITGIVFNLLLIPLLFGFRVAGVPYMKVTAERVDSELARKEKPGWWDKAVHDAWREISKDEVPKREEMVKEILEARKPYPTLVARRAESQLWMPLAFILGGWWLAGGRMLIGMGLMKLGAFAAKLSPLAYLRMVIFGYGIGVPLMLLDVYNEVSHGFFLGNQLWHVLDGWILVTFLGSLPVVVGHTGLIMLFYNSGALPWLTNRLAAVGRTALSNYLLTSIICTTIFYRYGFDCFGTLDRPMLYAIVLMIWAFQLVASKIWLEYFHFGPAEWLWRSLTYWKRQPMRLRASEEVA
jgi:uncharacterized protein